MKTKFNKFLLLIVVFVSFSCKKDTIEPTTTGTTTSTATNFFESWNGEEISSMGHKYKSAK